MGLFAPVENTTVTILGGTTTNSAGDIIDAGTPIKTGISACLVETSKTVYDPATQMPRTIRSSTLWLSPETSVSTDDQIQDESTGHVFMIIGIVQAPTILPIAAPIMLDLKRVTGKTA